MIFGLLGDKLGHSFSPKLHKFFGDYDYRLFEVKKSELEDFLKRKDIGGLNITMPYKKTVMKYCKTISEKAKKIGCVNTLIFDEDRNIHGYNTDYDGFLYLLKRSSLDIYNKKIIILGNGATSNTVEAVLKDLNITDIIKVGRKNTPINIKDIKEYDDGQIIINCTPVGMYPNCPKRIINIKDFQDLTGVIDIIYNPLRTNILMDTMKDDIPAFDGLSMLVGQGKFASELFQNKEISDEKLNSIIEKLRLETENIVIIGMPGSGKSSIGRAVARELGRDFIDTDQEIVKRLGMNIPYIFRTYGETYFRKIERLVIKDIGKLSNKVISTGGGVVTDYRNYYPLKQNGTIFYIKRSLINLSSKGRPLSEGGLDTLVNLYEQRKEKYEYFKDFTVENRYFKNTIDEIQELFYENSSN